MHTILVTAGGIALLLLFLAFGRISGRDDRRRVARSAVYFVPAWFLCAAANMYVGASRAGYSVAQEVPFFIVVFGLPTAVAVAVYRLAARQSGERASSPE